MVRFLNDPSAETNTAILKSLGAEISWQSTLIPTLVVLKCPLGNAKMVTTVLSLSPDVKYAEQASGPGKDLSLNPCSGPVAAPPPPVGTPDLKLLQWAIKNTGQVIGGDTNGVAGTVGADMRMETAWAITTGSSDIIVACAERAGVDITHHEIVNSLWTNPGETGLDLQGHSKETNGIDDDNDGIIDDVHGIAVLTDDSTGEILLSGNVSPNTAPDVRRDHGTSVAGIISAAHSNSGTWGIAPGCRLLSSKLNVSPPFEDTTANATIALDFFVRKGARVSTWAFTVPYSDAFADMIEYAGSHNHILVPSAGNEGCMLGNIHAQYYPALLGGSYKNVITVAALDNRDCLAEYPLIGPCGVQNASNYNSDIVYCAAPGWLNLSIHRFTTDPNNQYYEWFGGTSAAAPHVAGAIALLLSIHPELTPIQVRNRIAATGRALPSLAGKTITGKAIDVYHLLAD